MAKDLTFGTVDQEIRLHALNMAAALHKDTYRFRFASKDDDAPAEAAIGDQVLTDARNFAAWLKDGDAPREAVSA